MVKPTGCYWAGINKKIFLVREIGRVNRVAVLSRDNGVSRRGELWLTDILKE